jgi:surface polysaccharide O-acyltransferase-like enzyme
VPCECTTLLQLIDTDNKVLNKILVVFAALCTEVRYLQSEAKDKYYDTILYYGEGGMFTIVMYYMSGSLLKERNKGKFVCRYITCRRYIELNTDLDGEL